MKKFTNKFVAAVASLAMAGTLCVAGAVTMAGVAWGSPNQLQGPPDRPAPAPWEKGAPGKGTITILKCDAAESTTAAGGSQPAAGTDNKTPSCPTGRKALEGAKFSLKKVASITVGTGTDAKTTNLDLKSPESWQEIAKLATKLNNHTATEDGTDAEVKFDATNIDDQTTGKDGKATFNNLGLGLYKVIETEPPTGYGISDLQSFYMTLPLPEYTTPTAATGQSANTTATVTYNYNPVVKPKNKNLTDTIQKVYGKTTFASVNDILPYTITAGVNKAKIGTKNLTADDLQGYMVFDDAPTDALEAFKAKGESGDPTFADAVKSVKIGTTTLEKGTSATDEKDYTVSVIESASEADPNSKNLTAGHKRILVKFTDAGLGKIATALNGVTEGQEAPQVTVNLEFKVSTTYKAGEAPTGDASEQNGKNEIINASGFFPAHEKADAALPPIIPNTDKSKSTLDFGYLQVHKYYMKDGVKTDLSGAEFKIFADKDKAEGCYKALNENKAIAKNRNCKAASTFDNATTDAKGNFTKAYKTRAGDPVYLLEVKAPQGYARSTAVYEAKITKDKTSTIEIEDLPLKGGEDGKSFWFNLPATGAYGILIFAVVGMVLIVASVIMYVRNRKEEEQQQNA
ncbi:SpaH/EbpB family LPXTG-anchored major pilin [Gardnerella vaginalis]|uniref:SpaH/EbpB family LPXTG-anchored major pilin n=1 Tax=Gardnerella vaginalis TaxID=2702 RepID=UPI00040EEC40|nr:SpaH/EbpB family LPXTG-anchored major pilin [Gardnerella vaginalis]